MNQLDSAPRHSDQHGEGFSGWLAVRITGAVGTMACAGVFALIAFISLPDAINAGRPAIISWIAQTFLQLVLLSVIMVGQKVQAKATDAQTNHMAKGVDQALDRLDVHTQGGLGDVPAAVLAALDARDKAAVKKPVKK